MKSKFVFLFKESIKKKVCTKWFAIVNILLLILIPCLINIDSIIKFFGGDFEDIINIKVVDKYGIYDDFNNEINNSYTSLLESYNITISNSSEDINKVKEEIKNEKSDELVVYVKQSENLFDVEIISYDYIDTVLYQDIVNALNTIKESKYLEINGIDNKLLIESRIQVEVTRTLLNEDLDEDAELMSVIGGIIVILFIIPFFFLIIIIVQMIGAEINEEKSSKSMEIIISSVSPEVHFMSKLASANVFAIFQGLLLIVYAFIGSIIRVIVSSPINISSEIVSTELNGSINSYISAFINSGIINTITSGIPLFIIIMLLSFLAYSLLIGILASMTTNMEDYQQLQTPVMLFLVVGYYLAIISTVYNGATFINVASYIPFISGILAPVLYTLGEITITDLIIDIILLIITNYLLYKYGIKVYKVGILNYSSNKLWKKVFKSLKD